jgi:hypothetical protein
VQPPPALVAYLDSGGRDRQEVIGRISDEMVDALTIAEPTKVGRLAWKRCCGPEYTISSATPALMTIAGLCILDLGSSL